MIFQSMFQNHTGIVIVPIIVVNTSGVLGYDMALLGENAGTNIFHWHEWGVGEMRHGTLQKVS
jgi:hypothetical protein